MSVLANRQPRGLRVDGDIRINGQNVQFELMKAISGFVYQDDLFIPTLTVLEHLNLAAQLKLDRRTTIEYRKKLVNRLLVDVGLMKCANCLIGISNFGEGKLNLSGGELKRLSVATELLTDPPLLFCDEPTTGLDSYAALNLMKVMRKMTNQRGKTIICSIHQPSKLIFDLFHQIILLHDGKIAFSGSTKDALTFFQSIGFIYNEEQNPADFLVKSLAVVPTNQLQSANKATDICLKFEKSQYAKYAYDRIEQVCRSKSQKISTPEKNERISWFYMLYLMIYRDVLGTIRDSSIQTIRIVNKLVFSLILGFCVMRTPVMTQGSIQSLKGVLFLMVTENFFPPSRNMISHFPNKIFLFLREYANDMNTPLIFYLSSVVSLIPGFLIDPLISTVLLYVLLELRYCWFAFLGTITVCVLVFNTSAIFGIFISMLTDSVFVTESINSTIDTFFLSFSGVFMNVRSIPAIFSWIRHISWMTFAVEALLILQLNGIETIECSEVPSAPCLRNGEEVLDFLGFNSNNFERNITMMCYIYLILHVLSFVTLRFKIYNKTNR
ncbi:protein scarlet-like isoform X2 [Planococcus citri]